MAIDRTLAEVESTWHHEWQGCRPKHMEKNETSRDRTTREHYLKGGQFAPKSETLRHSRTIRMTDAAWEALAQLRKQEESRADVVERLVLREPQLQAIAALLREVSQQRKHNGQFFNGERQMEHDSVIPGVAPGDELHELWEHLEWDCSQDDADACDLIEEAREASDREILFEWRSDRREDVEEAALTLPGLFEKKSDPESDDWLCAYYCQERGVLAIVREPDPNACRTIRTIEDLETVVRILDPQVLTLWQIPYHQFSIDSRTARQWGQLAHWARKSRKQAIIEAIARQWEQVVPQEIRSAPSKLAEGDLSAPDHIDDLLQIDIDDAGATKSGESKRIRTPRIEFAISQETSRQFWQLREIWKKGSPETFCRAMEVEWRRLVEQIAANPPALSRLLGADEIVPESCQECAFWVRAREGWEVSDHYQGWCNLLSKDMGIDDPECSLSDWQKQAREELEAIALAAGSGQG